MHAGGVGNVAHHLAVPDIEHNHVRGARDEEPLRVRVEGQVVPAALAAQRDLLEQVISGSGK